MSRTHQRPTDRIDFWSEVSEADAVDVERVAAFWRLAFPRENLSFWEDSNDREDGESTPFLASETKGCKDRDDGVMKASVDWGPRRQHKATAARVALLVRGLRLEVMVGSDNSQGDW